MNSSQRQKLIDKMINEMKYTDKQVEPIVKDLSELHSDLVPLFESWLKDNKVQNYTCGEYSLIYFMDKRDMNYLASLLTIDWIIKDGEKAIELIKTGVM